MINNAISVMRQRDFIQGVSLPRSGHHLLERLLRRLLGDDVYCDYYICCRSIPCRFGRTFSKNHDLDLILPKRQSQKYLVQFRCNPQAQLEAYFRFFRDHYRNGPVVFEVQQHFDYFLDYYDKYYAVFLSTDPGDSKRQAAYDRFIQDHLDYYRSFLRKWVFDKRDANTFLLPYEKLLRSPEETLRAALAFIDPDFDVNASQFERIILEEDIRLKHDLSSSEFYRDDFEKRYSLVNESISLSALIQD